MMSGDHCIRGRNSPNSDDVAEREIASSPAGSKSPSKDSESPNSESNLEGAAQRNESGAHEEKSKVKLPKNELLDASEFNKTLGCWFGEKGFIAMRSFFRASVLNSLQKDPIGLNDTNCTHLDAAIVILIADYLVKNGKYFTMSVFSNEVLKPLTNSYPTLDRVLHRIGKCEELDEPTLTQEMVSFVLHALDVRSHSLLGSDILHKYLEARSGDLLSVLMGLLRDNAPILDNKERAVRDDDVVAAFSEGLQEEMGKLHCWFSNFNSQFVDVSGKLKKLMRLQTLEGGHRPQNVHDVQDEEELWNQMMRMDEHIKKQQDCLLKMRDKERRKLATYAKELQDLHREMNTKLKSIQDYERTLKIREKALRQNEAIGIGLVDCGRGDHKMVEIRQKRECSGTVKDTLGERHGSHAPHTTVRIGDEMTGQIMQENLELKAILREQNLRIEALTKRAALLSTECYVAPTIPPLASVYYAQTPSNAAGLSRIHVVTSSDQAYQPSKPPLPVSSQKPFAPGVSLVSAMTSALRRARMEIDSLRNEQNSTDLQYDRLLHNKLSKRL